MDEKIDALMGCMTALTAALTRVADNQDRLLAGMETATAKIEGPKPATTRGRRKKDDEPEQDTPENGQQAEPAATASEAAAAISAGDGEVTDDMVKATATAWFGKTDDPAEKERRAKWLQEAIGNITGLEPGKLMLTGPDSKLGAEGRKKIVFYIKRAFKLGDIAKVTLGGAYDFDGLPEQPEPAGATAAAEPAFDPLG